MKHPGATFADSKTILTNSYVSSTVSPTKRQRILIGCAKMLRCISPNVAHRVASLACNDWRLSEAQRTSSQSDRIYGFTA